MLFEHPAKNAPMHGFTDNYVRVELPFEKSLINTVRNVKIGDSKKKIFQLYMHSSYKTT